MTYNANDPNNRNPRARADDDRSYAGWIIGGLVAVAIIVGFMFVLPMTNSNTASNSNNRSTVTNPVRPATPPASTTGSGTTSPAPASPAAPATSR